MGPGLPNEMKHIQGSKNIIISSNGSKMSKAVGLLSSTPITGLPHTFGNSLLATNHSKTPHDDHESFNYPLYVAVPVGLFLMTILLIFVVCL